MKSLVVTFVLSLLLVVFLSHPAAAIVQYQKQFVKLYVGDNADPESELAKLVKNKKLRCLTCHQGKKKKNCNPYGEHFRDLLDRKKDKKDEAKIIAALKKVEQMPSVPDDKESPTYAELMAAGELPGGSLEELQVEPPSEKEE